MRAYVFARILDQVGISLDLFQVHILRIVFVADNQLASVVRIDSEVSCQDDAFGQSLLLVDDLVKPVLYRGCQTYTLRLTGFFVLKVITYRGSFPNPAKLNGKDIP